MNTHATLYSVQLPLTIHVHEHFCGFSFNTQFHFEANLYERNSKIVETKKSNPIGLYSNRSVWTKTKILENLQQKPKYDNNNGSSNSNKSNNNNNMFQFLKFRF